MHKFIICLKGDKDMNEYVKKVLFGAQRQASKQNEAVVDLVEYYIGKENCTSEEKVVSCIMDKIASVDKLSNDIDNKLTTADRVFITSILGKTGIAAIESGEDFDLRTEYVGTNGKINFYLVPQGGTSEVAMELKAEEERRNSDAHRESVSKEDYADELIKKILSVTPPAKRAELPEDDARAALCVSKEYWSTNS